MRSVLPIAVCLLLASIRCAAAAVIVKDGEPRAVIVIPETPSPAARKAANVLRDHLKQISGAELPIHSERSLKGPPKAAKPWILVGEGKTARGLKITADDLGPGGVVLESRDDLLALIGTDDRTPSDPWGSLYAVTMFLEDRLGVRYLWPGESGKVVPARKTIDVPALSERKTPKLPQRVIRSSGWNDRIQKGLDNLGFTREEFEAKRKESSVTVSESPDWFQWHRLGGTLNLGSGHAFGHLWEKYGKEHPEWFAMQPDGSRDQSSDPDRARLCESNRELIAAIAREKIAEMKEHPERRGVSIAPNDGGRLTYCSCPDCEKLDAKDGRRVKLLDFTQNPRREYEHVALTDRMVHFWNAIAAETTKAYPDRLLVVDAYAAYASPPVRSRLHPNLVVRFAALEYENEEDRQSTLADWDVWAKATGKIFFRPNLMLAGRRNGLPLIYVHKFGEDFRRLSERGMMGTDFDSVTHHWATQGLNYYVVAKLHWDPELNVSAIVNDWCRSGFGPAAEPIKEYFTLHEQLLQETAQAGVPAGSRHDAPIRERMALLMEKAKSLAGDDAVVRKRVELLEIGRRWTDIELQAHDQLRAARVASSGRGKNVDDPPATRHARKVLEERRKIMAEIFQHHPLALNVAMISWGEDGAFGPLQQRLNRSK